MPMARIKGVSIVVVLTVLGAASLIQSCAKGTGQVTVKVQKVGT